ncbi:MAG: YidC/Oxa1 family membrane protein insertase, partial [Fibrobacter sp.]|nr:YidC/Oxa1 family membrane protein insertase [Fibrobacter sp.]
MKKTVLHFLALWLIILGSFVSSDCAQLRYENGLYSLKIEKRTYQFLANGDLAQAKEQYDFSKPTSTHHTFSNPDNSSILRLRVKNDQFVDSCFYLISSVASKEETDSTIRLTFLSEPFLSTSRYTKTYTIHKVNHCIDFTFMLLENESDQLLKNATFQVEVSSLGNEHIKPVIVDKKHGSRHPDTSKAYTSENLWGGIHTKFWTICVQPENRRSPVSFTKNKMTADFVLDSINKSEFRVYCGPVVVGELKKADKTLTKLIYTQPFFMNWLSSGFLIIFNTLLKISGSVVLSLLLLSVSVKLVLAPLYRIASVWQTQVNLQSSILEPKLKEIKKQYKGEEQNQKILELHKQLGISPLYTLKSLLSAAIQIPVFFAAYNMLSHHIALCDSVFLWIPDLSAPDHLFRFPISIPFFGEYFNVLPVIMTLFTIASSYLHTDVSLS